MQSVVTKSAEALGRSGKPFLKKSGGEARDAFPPIAHETKKAHKKIEQCAN